MVLFLHCQHIIPFYGIMNSRKTIFYKTKETVMVIGIASTLYLKKDLEQ